MIRVLIVDDSPTARALLRRVLECDSDIEVVGEAGTGREGVEMAANLLPDLVTMDMVMPEMDGLEATRRIMRDHPVPILVVTADPHYNEVNVLFEALAAGALDLTEKVESGNHGQARESWEKGLVAKVKALALASRRPPSRSR